MNGHALSIRGLTLEFSGVRALNDVSFEVEPGEILGVIGPNGAGKTSLFNCISGVYKPTRGDILLNGKSSIDLRPTKIARHGVARMFQNLAVFESLTTLENLLLGRHVKQKTTWLDDLVFSPRAKREALKSRAEVEDIIEVLDLEPYRDQMAGLLPYGVLKRIELGRALAAAPQLLLLDEPAAGLNREETENMARFIMETQRAYGVTQILIEHELAMVLDLADHVVVLDFGECIAFGTPDEIREDERVLAAYAGGIDG